MFTKFNRHPAVLQEYVYDRQKDESTQADPQESITENGKQLEYNLPDVFPAFKQKRQERIDCRQDRDIVEKIKITDAA